MLNNNYNRATGLRPACAYLLLLCLAAFGVGCGKSDTETASTPKPPAAKTASTVGVDSQTEKSRDQIEQQLLSALSVGRYRDDLDGLRERGVIRALVTYSQTDFFLDDGYIRGLQADALRAFEKQLNAGVTRADQKLSIKYIPVPFNRLIPALNEGVGDIAAALLTVTPERKKQVLFASGGKLLVKELVVRHKDAAPISTLPELQGKTVYLLNGSSYAEHLRAFNRSLGLLEKKIHIVEADPLLLSEDLLELVNAGVMKYTVVDSYKADLWSQVLTNLVVEQQAVVSDSNQLGWAVRKDNPQLYASLTSFIKGTAKKGTLLGNMLTKRYLGTTRWIKDPLISGERDKLNRLLPLFARYGQQYRIDPLALAAQAYQESRFDQSLKSHRGAVGIMQLLPTTAADKQVAIKQIDKLENNVHAGAKYLAFLRDRYFDDPKIS
ncbi:MAG: lytic transglycosylase F, partial [Motiliproteus sp.]|nr:lytic transglycosylase F [Motiliproteus sp.]